MDICVSVTTQIDFRRLKINLRESLSHISKRDTGQVRITRNSLSKPRLGRIPACPPGRPNGRSGAGYSAWRHVIENPGYPVQSFVDWDNPGKVRIKQ